MNTLENPNVDSSVSSHLLPVGSALVELTPRSPLGSGDSKCRAEHRDDASRTQAGLVLVVDDDAFNLDMLSRRLERSGFRVKVADSGAAALQSLQEHDFDLVLLDQMMPEMSGAEVLHAIRNDVKTEMVPVIMVTAIAESEKISEALECGASDYITKPVDYKVALARIRMQLARKRAEDALRQSEERYALAAKASRDGLWDWDLKTEFFYFSPRWKEMLDLSAEIEPHANSWFSRITVGDRQRVLDLIASHVSGTDDVLQCSYTMWHADSTLRWMSCHGIVTRDGSGRAVRIAGSQSDITEEKTQDALTGLPNRLLMVSQLDSAIHGSAVGDDSSSGLDRYALLFLDLNGFKTINDTLGHIAGDHLLQAIARRLETAYADWSLQASNSRLPLIARMGGDEFAVLLEGNAVEPEVLAFARKVRAQMKNPFDLDGRPVHCAFSIGVALQSPSHGRAEDVLREADIAMYTAKALKNGEIVIFEPRMKDIAENQLDLENSIHMAVAAGELLVAYQPKVDLATGTTYGFEGLVRWNHPTRGLLQPGAFISVAEKTGDIVEIGKWVLREACRQVRSWHKEFPSSSLLELSINLSPREFKQTNLVEEVALILRETGFPAELLHLEITEDVLFDDLSAARRKLCALKELGLKLDIDDFGSGYSSLKYLRELPFDSIKIDRHFIAALDPRQSSSGELIRIMIDMAQALGLTVVAEGIEHADHTTALKDLGCRLGQGFYYGKPLDPYTIAGTFSDASEPVQPDGALMTAISRDRS